MVAVNPDILRWAREAAALDVNDAARKLGFQDSDRSTAAEKLKLLEAGRKEPTQKQLLKMSDKYYQPLLVFYGDSVPPDGDYGTDFRTTYQKSADPKGNAYLQLLMRNIKASQSLARDLLEDEDTEPVDFIATASIAQGVQSVANDIVTTLQFDLNHFRAKRNARQAFDYLRKLVENTGVFVLLESDLGSHHTSISAQVFRGFAYADDMAPFVVVNRKDARAAWSFTVLHELAHLWLGTSGVSGAWGDHEVEQFCNRVASQILLPLEELETADIDASGNIDQIERQTGLFADSRNISGTMVAYNLMRIGKICPATFKVLSDRFYEHWQHQQAKNRKANKNRDGGPSYYTVRRHQLGPALISLARRSMDSFALTPSKASIMLRVPARSAFALTRDINSVAGP